MISTWMKLVFIFVLYPMVRCFFTNKLSGHKKAKEHITVLVCANMDASDKRPLLSIGKGNQPLFRGVPTLPTPYTSSSNAWMTSSIFRKWLIDLNRDNYGKAGSSYCTSG